MLIDRNTVSFWIELFLPGSREMLPEKTGDAFVVLPEALESLRDFMGGELFFLAKDTLDEAYTDEICGDDIVMRLCIEEFNGEERTNALRNLTELLRKKGKDAFAEKAPLLRPLMESWVFEYGIFLRKLIDDLAEVSKEASEKLFGGLAIREIRRIESPGRKYYTGTKAVTFVETDCGKLVWKGRDCRIDLWYEQLCDRYFSDFIYVPRTVACGDRFGIFEFVEHCPAKEKEAAAITGNLGRFAALSTVLGSGDLSCENVMLKGGKIVPIDLEMIMKSGDSFFEKIFSRFGKEEDFSLLYSRLLWNPYSDKYDFPSLLSLRNIEKPGARLWFSGEPDKETCLKSMLSGYEEVSKRCLSLREELSFELKKTKDFSIRKIFANAMFYRLCKRKLRHPKNLQSAEQRKELVIQFQKKRAEQNPDIVPLLEAENECLLRQHIPLFTMKVGGRDILYEGKVLVRDYQEVSAFERANRILANLNEQMIKRNMAFIRAISLPEVLSLPEDASCLAHEDAKMLLMRLNDSAVELSDGKLIWFCRTDGSGQAVTWNKLAENQKRIADFCRSAQNCISDPEWKKKALCLAERTFLELF